MRYIINDDDLEDWHDRLKNVMNKYEDIDLEYVISEMQSNISDPFAFKQDEIVQKEIERLKTLLFHFTGEME